MLLSVNRFGLGQAVEPVVAFKRDVNIAEALWRHLRRPVVPSHGLLYDLHETIDEFSTTRFEDLFGRSLRNRLQRFFSSKSKNYKFVVFFGFFHFDLAENIRVPKRSWCLLIMASSSHFESSAKQLTGSTNLPRDIHSLTGQQPAAQRNVRQLASICDLFRDWFVKCL